MARRRKPAHVEADFGDDDARRRVTNAGNRHESIDSILKRSEGITQARLHAAHGDLERIDVGQMQTQQKAMVWCYPPVQSGDDGRSGRLEPSLAEIGQTFGILFSANDRFNHRAATRAEHIADDARKFQIGAFEDFLQTQCVLGDFADQLLPRARQIAQFLNGRGWDETAANQAVREQVGNPRSIVHVVKGAEIRFRPRANTRESVLPTDRDAGHSLRCGPLLAPVARRSDAVAGFRIRQEVQDEPRYSRVESAVSTWQGLGSCNDKRGPGVREMLSSVLDKRL
jgi:hypothetical protein